MPSLSKLLTAGLSARQFSGAGKWAGSDALSSLGTSLSKNLPPFLTNNPISQGFPWGGRSAGNTNPYDQSGRPNTGVTRYYDWTISETTGAPDGVENKLLLVNGQFPGPTVEANWGDWVEIKVYNNLTDEGASLHWHGLLQQETPWMDGVPGYGQCPIAPGSEFTYRYRADLYGTSWWHAHYSSQYASGLAGPMVIYGPKNVDYDIDVGPIAVTDYFHSYYEPIVQGFFKQPVEVTLSDNNLINGKNNYDGNDAPLASFNFTSGKKHRLRLINTSAFAVERISLDGHTMQVIANDFVPLQPFDVTSINLAVGQRVDVIVEANGDPSSSYWLRAYKSPNCSPSKPGSYYATAAVFYENADRSSPPSSSAQSDAFDDYCGNLPLDQTEPYYAIAADENPSSSEILPIEFKSNGTSDLWYMANRTFRVDYNDPILLETKLNQLDFDYTKNVHNYGSNNTVRFIVENPGVAPHPMHLHGHNIQILAEGSCSSNTTVFGNNEASMNGTGGNITNPDTISIETSGQQKRDMDTMTYYGNCWDGTIVRPENPQRRDVQMLLPESYIVIQWTQDNPGIWPFHCHIAWHLSGGMVWNVLERPDDIQKDMEIPSVMSQTCRDWWSWTGNNVVDVIDSGI